MQPAPKAAASRGTKLYFIATLVAQICALSRYALIARILGPAELGLAATLIITQQFFDSISDSGADRFVVQDPEGDSPNVQKFLHMVLMARGVFTATALMLFSAPLALFYSTPKLAHGMVMLAIVPLIAGGIHLDLRRTQRRHDFRIEASAILFAEVLGLCATVAAAFLTRAYTCVVYGLVVRSIAMVTVSHLLAERPYRVGFSREHINRVAGFSLPLMFNGALFFLGSQGDRILVANRIGPAGLGHYSAVLLLILYPAAMLTRFLMNLHLPKIGAARADRDSIDQASNALGSVTLVLALAMCCGFALVAPRAITLLYGERFAMAAPLVCLVGILQTTRFMRLWPSTTALGLGRSGIVLADNLCRLPGLLAAVLGAALAGLAGAIVGFIAGELIALIATKCLLNRAEGRALLHGFQRIATYVVGALLVFGGSSLLALPGLGPIVMYVAGACAGAWLLTRLEPVATAQFLGILARLRLNGERVSRALGRPFATRKS